MCAVREAVDLDVTTNRQSSIVKDPRIDGRTGSVAGCHVVFFPHDDKPTPGEGGHRAGVLRAGGLLIDADLSTNPRAGRVEDLGDHRVAGTIAGIAGALGGPGDHVAAIGQRCDLWLELGCLRLRLDLQFRYGDGARGVIAVQLDAGCGIVTPDDHPATIVQTRDTCVELRLSNRRVDLEFSADRDAVCIVPLGKDASIAVARIVLICRRPDRDIATVSQTIDGAVGLIADGDRVHAPLGSDKSVAIHFGGDVNVDEHRFRGGAVAILDDQRKGDAGCRVI